MHRSPGEVNACWVSAKLRNRLAGAQECPFKSIAHQMSDASRHAPDIQQQTQLYLRSKALGSKNPIVKFPPDYTWMRLGKSHQAGKGIK